MNEAGVKLAEVGIVPTGKTRWWQIKEERIYETVLHAMSRLGEKAKDVFLIAKFEPVDKFFSEKIGTFAKLTLLKSPKGYSVQEWFAEVHQRDVEAFKTEIADIDN